MQEAIEAWEGEGGALRQGSDERVTPRFAFARGGPVAAEKKMIGTASQMDWAERIRRQVSAEFDRVAKALESAMSRQAERKRGETLTAIAILEDKRAEVMAQDHGLFTVSGTRYVIRCASDRKIPDTKPSGQGGGAMTFKPQVRFRGSEEADRV
jgi:hypothetical protein